jgi:hypothetical protein
MQSTETSSLKGHPLSPYLIVLCAKGYSYLLNDAEMRDKTSGTKVCQAAPNIRYILFVDDSLLEADVANAREVGRILTIYAASSGQVTYKDKFSNMTSKNTRDAQNQAMMRVPPGQ